MMNMDCFFSFFPFSFSTPFCLFSSVRRSFDYVRLSPLSLMTLCVCVCERERERERELSHYFLLLFASANDVLEC